MERLVINERIRKVRWDSGLSQAEFANKLTEFSGKKYTRSDINNWETGSYNIKADTILNIMNCFDVSADYLFGRAMVAAATPDLTSAAKYTGLSEQAVMMLHNLSPQTYDGDNEYSIFMRDALNRALSFCLGDVEFYQYIMESIAQLLLAMEKSDAIGAPEPLTEDEQQLAHALMQKGYSFRTPDDVVDERMKAVVDQTSRYWNSSVKFRDVTPQIKQQRETSERLFLKSYGIEEA